MRSTTARSWVIMQGDQAVLRQAAAVLGEAGLRASVAVKDLRSGRGLAIEADEPYPLASVVKLPLALAVLRRFGDGDLDPASPVQLDATERTPGPTGLSQFEHPATVAVEDLLGLAVCASDDTAADALFRFCPPEAVTAMLRELGVTGITVRHSISELHRTLADRLAPDEMPQALALAIQASTAGKGHLIPQLDVTNANAGTARALIQLLESIWCDTRFSAVKAPLRRLLGLNMMRQRLAPDLESDDAAWHSKTGTFLHLRHEVGVLEHADGGVFAIAVLSESSVPARRQPAAEQALGRAAKLLHDRVRSAA
ncbi:serine hydrolase [Agromyces subbeticus]|uniref:serine hydrolase n=1 Tax=Agromyces subbeticus TaxID=293890 RepID=UPI0003B59FE7|nr:serine hydrolase [Agromyces subbeticus]